MPLRKPAARPAAPAQEEPTHGAELKIAAHVPYPDGRGGSIPYSSIEFSLYNQPAANGQIDVEAALAALADFHQIVMQHYQYSADCRRERDDLLQRTRQAGRPAAAVVTADSDPEF